MPTCLNAPCPGPSVPLTEDPTWNVTEFHTTPVMSTYLLAYIVSEFTCVQETAENDVLVRSWAHLSFPRIGRTQETFLLSSSLSQPRSC